MTQSEDIPIHTPIGPVFTTRIKNVVRATRQVHIVTEDKIIENFTSPDALSPYAGMKDQLQANGFIMCTKIVSCTVKRATAASIRERAVKGFTKPITAREETVTAIKLKKVSFFMYFLASSLSPAPIACPVKVIKPIPIPIGAWLENPSSTEVKAFAAIAAVPRVETEDCIASFPNWNIPFSIPVGIPIPRIFLIVAKSGFTRYLSIFICCFVCFRKIKITAALKILEASVLIAAPATLK